MECSKAETLNREEGIRSGSSSVEVDDDDEPIDGEVCAGTKRNISSYTD